MARPRKPAPPRKASTQTKIFTKSKDKCGVCEDSNAQTIEVIDEDNQNTLDMYHEMGLLLNNNVNARHNRIFLCSCCEERFSENPPAWVFLPKNLKNLLRTEREFQRQRESTRDGKALQRQPPTSNEHKKHEFIIYQTRENGVHKNNMLVDSQRREWTCSPIVAIIHGAGALYKHVRLDSKNYGIPEDVVKTLHSLLLLYGRSAPKVVDRPDPEQEGGEGAGMQDAGEQAAEGQDAVEQDLEGQDAGEQDSGEQNPNGQNGEEQDAEDQGVDERDSEEQDSKGKDVEKQQDAEDQDTGEQDAEEQDAGEHGVGQEQGAIRSNNKRNRPRDSGYRGESSSPTAGATSTDNARSPEGMPPTKRSKPSPSLPELAVGTGLEEQHGTSSRQPREAARNSGGGKSRPISSYMNSGRR